MDKRHGAFTVGDWDVFPDEGVLRRDDEARRLQPKVMDVLCRLAAAGGGVVAREELIADVWQGRAMSDEPLHRCIAELRAALGDDRSEPRYIRTLPRRGYQIMAVVDRRAATVSGWRRAGAFIGVVLLALFAMSLRPPHVEAAVSGLVVLPLESHSAEGGQELLAAAITEELVSALTQTSGATVLSRDITFGDEAVRGDLAALGASHVLTGSLRVHSRTLRVTVLLTDIRNRRHVFSREFEYPTGKASALLDDIAQTIANEVGEMRNVPQPGPAATAIGFEDYRNFLEARHLWRRGLPGDIEDALTRMRTVVEHRPDLAAAHALLAFLYQWQSWHDPGRPDRHLLVEHHRDEALALDPGDPVALLVLANTAGTPLEVDRLLQRALMRAPHLVEVQLRYVAHLYSSGYLQEAVAQVESMQSRDPLSPRLASLRAALLYTMDPQDPRTTFFLERAASGDPSRTMRLRMRRALDAGGSTAAAAILSVTRTGGSDTLRADEASALAAALHSRAANPAALHAMEKVHESGAGAYWQFHFWNLLRETANALTVLDAQPPAAAKRFSYLFWDTRFGALRRAPGFLDFARRQGLIALWRARGHHDFCSVTDGGVACR